MRGLIDTRTNLTVPPHRGGGRLPAHAADVHREPEDLHGAADHPAPEAGAAAEGDEGLPAAPHDRAGLRRRKIGQI